jgi:hypothetical protein
MKYLVLSLHVRCMSSAPLPSLKIVLQYPMYCSHNHIEVHSDMLFLDTHGSMHQDIIYEHDQ